MFVYLRVTNSQRGKLLSDFNSCIAGCKVGYIGYIVSERFFLEAFVFMILTVKINY